MERKNNNPLSSRVFNRVHKLVIDKNAKSLYKTIWLENNKLKKSKDVKVAVIIHLYYVDLWPSFRNKLEKLSNINYDLFVTIPEGQAETTQDIKKFCKGANVYTVPNIGRDVLPFIFLSNSILHLGYTSLLKLHSKKSTHREDGNEWLSGMLNTLLPENEKVLKVILTKLEDPNTGIIGPEKQYISLPVNYDANSKHIETIIMKLFDKETSNKVSENRSDYGFFAGTMFWARFDALDSILKLNLKVSDFEPERGQIDGTLPHALERVFTLNSELLGKNIYEAKKNSAIKLKYKTNNIPEWSELYRNKE